MFRAYPYLSGLGEAPAVPSQLPAAEQSDGYEEPRKYIFTKTLAAQGDAGDSFLDLSQYIDKNADFTLTAIAAVSTGNFSANIKDHGGRDIFSGMAQAANFAGTGQFPIDWEVPLFYPAGSRMGLALANLTAAPNTIELCLIGIARYKAKP